METSTGKTDDIDLVAVVLNATTVRLGMVSTDLGGRTASLRAACGLLQPLPKTVR